MSTLRNLLPVLVNACLLTASVGAQQAPASAPEKVSGLRAAIEIVRDGQGVPHIRAENELDAVFGLGFVHAQDRLWQLEYMRRLGSGRLSEVLGSPALRGDRLFRTLGVSESAAATWVRYSPRQRDLLSAYVGGLNAATDRLRKAKLPIEFLILGFSPEPWRAEDVLTIAKVLGWTVDQNWDQELLRLQLIQKVGPGRASQLMPPYPADGPVILPASGQVLAGNRSGSLSPKLPRLSERMLSGLTAWNRDVVAWSGLGGQGLGSNNQVVAGALSVTGAPILASDPHLPSQLPSIFYMAHLTGGGLDAIGATVAGLPGVFMGHNGRVAWGWTNANADVQDLFTERIFDGREAEYNGAREPLRVRREIIRVKNGTDVELTVRSSRHGPLVSDLIDPNGPALALRWAALDTDDDVGITAFLEANKAGNGHQFAEAFRRFKSHAQNMVYADTEGNIGYLLTGAIPIRAAGDGTTPVPGWTSDYEWTGYVPAAELPSALNPTQGYLASANNKIAPDSYPYKLSNSFAAPYRAARVVELLKGERQHSPASFEKLQSDVMAIHARELLPLLNGYAHESPSAREAVNMLAKWDGRVTAESPAAAIFEAWYIQLAESIFRDELGETLWLAYSGQLHMVSNALASAIRNQPEWCDDAGTPERESCPAIAASALRTALGRMAAAQGTENMAAWQWGRVHRTIFFHQPFGTDPLLSLLFSRTIANGGDKHTVNVASSPVWADYDQRHVALYRQIIDLGNFSNSRWMAAPGQSGVLFSPHYDDLIAEWQRVEYRPMLFTRQAVDRHAVDRLVLQP